MPYCPNCGEWVDAEAKFCTTCGEDVKDVGRGNGGDPARNQEPGQPGRGREHGQPTGGQQPARGQEHGQPARSREGGQPVRGQPPGGATPELLQESTDGFEFGISYPKHGSWTPALISGVMLFLSWLVVPALILIGYGYRVARAATLGRSAPPQYEDWGGLIVDGLRFLVVLVVIGIVFVVFTGVVGAAAGQGSQGSGPLAVLLLLGYAVLLYVTPAYLTAFVGSDDVVEAFTDGRAISLATSGYYVKAILFAILLRIVLNILLYFSAITIVGPIFVAAYMVPAFGAFWGYVYYQAAQKGIVPPPVPDEPPAPEPAGSPARQPSP